MKEKKYKYQLVLVLDLKAEKREEALDKVSSWLQGQGVEVEKKDHMGTKELVYDIKGNTKGDFWIMDLVTVDSLKLNELNVLLNRDTNIIRYLILKKE